MANITDFTYYTGKKFIPNINNLNTEIAGVPNSGNDLQLFIDKYERQLLIDFLNIDLYNELNTALDDLPNADVKWRNLVEGVEYTKDSKKYRFDGLRGNEKDSLVAYYVFCKYLENDESYYSTTGTIKADAANSNNFTPTRKYQFSWYEFLEKYQNEDRGNYPKEIYYDGVFVGLDYYNARSENYLVTLETFLKDNESDYEGYNFKYYESMNSLGI